MNAFSSNRRSFLQLSAAVAAVAAVKQAPAQPAGITITSAGATWNIKTPRYSFTYRADKDRIDIFDEKGLSIASGPLQPSVRVMQSSGTTICSAGKPAKPVAEHNRLTVRYDGVNGTATLTISLRFDEHGIWMEPVQYESTEPQDVVSLHYFATNRLDKASGQATLSPGLRSAVVTVPGIAEADAVSDILPRGLNYTRTISLGHSGFYNAPFTHQQWGLPIHYFSLLNTKTHDIAGGRKDTYTRYRSAAMVCGLADLPNGDLLLDVVGGATSPWIDYRSDLWHHQKTPGTLTLGATFAFAFGEDTLAAITAYYDQLVRTSLIARKTNSAKKNAVLAAPQFCTWGAQVERSFEGKKLTETFLRDLYAEVKSTGMKAKLFSIDDKWEGRYGNLEHDAERFPHFEAFLDSIRAEGNHVGLWAAFMRCEKPEDLGLTVDHMLMDATGKPHRGGGNQYYLLDFTHPDVEKVLTDRAHKFVRRYKPAVVKFDFGYELPAVRTAAPYNKNFAGERILRKGLEIIVSAMRQADPDIVVMYYQLSPMFAEFFDFHSTDDLYINPGDYDWEANRRIYFASPLTQLGIAIYGSSGYDWSSSPVIWFDSVAAGTIGSLNDFDGDEFGEKQTPAAIARYNGLAQSIRTGNRFQVLPYPPTRPEAAVRGGHTKSWARIENGVVTVLAQRPPSFDDGDMLDWRRTDTRVEGILTTTAPVVVASKTAQSVIESSHLAIVPCTNGLMQLHRRGAVHLQATTHYFGGKTRSESIKVRDGLLTLPLTITGPDGTPVEWIEITEALAPKP